MSSPLSTVPNEILTHIAFHLSALSLRALPDALLPLRYSSKFLYHRLSPEQNPQLYARIYQLKFDDSAVRRRAFSPNDIQYTDHLALCCKTLAAIQNQDFDADDPETTLFAAYLMLLDNDGRNRAQLEWAGIDQYIDSYIRTRMYDPVQRMASNGWPVDSTGNACALWLMWMLTTPEKLEAESPLEREQIVLSVLPFTCIPFRYASAHAPPLHYYLPLPNPANNYDDSIFSIQTAHGPYPIYRFPNQAWSQVYYSSRPLLVPPLAAEAAKLIYQSRRDMAQFPIPPHLPPTRADAIALGITEVIPTQEDIIDVNSHKSAKLVKRIIWDWNRGVGVEPGANDGIEHFEASRMWDCEWWRLRFCWDTWRSQPRWRPGKVYMPGMLSGLWQGKMMLPSEAHLMMFLDQPAYPTPLFTEAMLLVTTRPIYMRLTEHHCTVNQTRLRVPEAIAGETQDNGVQSAWFEGPPGSLRWQTTVDHVNDEQRVTIYTHTGQVAEYQTYKGGAEWSGYGHEPDNCPGCRARSELISEAEGEARRKGREEEAERRDLIERTFASVGLGQENGIPVDLGDQTMEIDEEGEDEDLGDGDDISELDIMEAGEYEDEEPVMHNGKPLPRVAKNHDWVHNVVECDGIRDIIVTGSTDDSHGQAWHHYVYYGRVRPWDGLIGILRVPRNALQGTAILYGYISGGKNFSGNWRWALSDPLMPAWESAVVMSKRDE